MPTATPLFHPIAIPGQQRGHESLFPYVFGMTQDGVTELFLKRPRHRSVSLGAFWPGR